VRAIFTGSLLDHSMRAEIEGHLDDLFNSLTLAALDSLKEPVRFYRADRENVLRMLSPLLRRQISEEALASVRRIEQRDRELVEKLTQMMKGDTYDESET